MNCSWLNEWVPFCIMGIARHSRSLLPFFSKTGGWSSVGTKSLLSSHKSSRVTEASSPSQVQVFEIFKNPSPSRVESFGPKKPFKSSHLGQWLESSLKSFSLAGNHNHHARDGRTREIFSTEKLESREGERYFVFDVKNCDFIILMMKILGELVK